MRHAFNNILYKSPYTCIWAYIHNIHVPKLDQKQANATPAQREDTTTTAEQARRWPPPQQNTSPPRPVKRVRRWHNRNRRRRLENRMRRKEKGFSLVFDFFSPFSLPHSERKPPRSEVTIVTVEPDDETAATSHERTLITKATDLGRGKSQLAKASVKRRRDEAATPNFQSQWHQLERLGLVSLASCELFMLPELHLFLGRTCQLRTNDA